MDIREQLSKFLEANPKEPSAENGPTAAVLLPLGIHKGGEKLEILLTKRTHLVQTHKGQISFPGGLREPEDEDLKVTALRETHEEVGLLSSHVEVVGSLPVVRTRGALPILPWVGIFELPYDFQLNEDEVDSLLYLPLERLLDQGLHRVTVPVENVRVQSIGIELEGELVWGATARVLEVFREGLLRP